MTTSTQAATASSAKAVNAINRDGPSRRTILIIALLVVTAIVWLSWPWIAHHLRRSPHPAATPAVTVLSCADGNMSVRRSSGSLYGKENPAEMVLRKSKPCKIEIAPDLDLWVAVLDKTALYKVSADTGGISLNCRGTCPETKVRSSYWTYTPQSDSMRLRYWYQSHADSVP